MTPTPSATPAHTSNTTSRLGRRGLILVAALAVAGAVLAALVGPDPRLGQSRSGDPELARQVEEITGPGRGITALSVARVDVDATRFAGFGHADGTENGAPPSPETPFELGSVTKTFTGHLLADAVERGEMVLSDPLARHLPELENTPAGAATLEQLATHTSGLPRMPAEMVGLGSVRSAFAPDDPYGVWSASRVVDAARTAQVDDVGAYHYSNFGMALLGHAQARAAGSESWSELATTRLLTPLGMTSTRFVGVSAAEPAGLAAPHWANGRTATPWTGDGFAPAGSSTRTTATDLARFAAAVVDGTVPGAAATTPLVEVENGYRALSWGVERADDATGDSGRIVSHRGGTGGSRTVLAIDREAGQASIALATTDRAIDELGADLLHEREARLGVHIDHAGLVGSILAGALLASAAFALARPTRLALVAAGVDTSVALVVLLALAPWSMLPAAAIGALLGVLVGMLALVLIRLPQAPAQPRKGRIGAFVSLALSLLLAVALPFVLL